MRRLLPALLALLLLGGCAASMSSVRTRHDTLRLRLHQAKRFGAMECAPRDLARAQAAYRFASMALTRSDLLRAEEHLQRGLEAAERAAQAGKRCGVRGPVHRDPNRDPWIDADGDGLVGLVDRCPYALEDKDGFEDGDGCPEEASAPEVPPEPEPDLDSDGDGIPDSSDACPDEPETADGVADEDGCPEFQPLLLNVSADSITFKQKPRFSDGELDESAHPALLEVVQVLINRPGWRLRIEGHSDNRGEEPALVAESLERAEAIQRFLVQQGVDPGRLEATGRGSAMPLTTNRTPMGRDLNRRVELVVLEGTPPSEEPPEAPAEPVAPPESTSPWGTSEQAEPGR